MIRAERVGAAMACGQFMGTRSIVWLAAAFASAPWARAGDPPAQHPDDQKILDELRRPAARSPADGPEAKTPPGGPSKTVRQAHDDAVLAALEEFKKAVRATRVDGEQASAVFQLAQSEQDVRILSQLAPYLISGGDLVRQEAIRALKAYRRDPAAVQALAAAVPACRGKGTAAGRLIEAIGAVGHESAIPFLADRLGDEDAAIAAAAARALAAIPSAASVEGLLKAYGAIERDKKKLPGLKPDPKRAMEERVKVVTAAVEESLKALTGQAMRSRGEYEAWWAQNRSTFKPTPEKASIWVCPAHQLPRGGKS
jgi:hypothetical protein